MIAYSRHNQVSAIPSRCNMLLCAKPDRGFASCTDGCTHSAVEISQRTRLNETKNRLSVQPDPAKNAQSTPVRTMVAAYMPPVETIRIHCQRLEFDDDATVLVPVQQAIGLLPVSGGRPIKLLIFTRFTSSIPAKLVYRKQYFSSLSCSSAIHYFKQNLFYNGVNPT